ncbi:hypothetical protein N4G41_13225 [Kosakonia sacchari]|uniref:hypothetical protein n=1 Tax=Kosakonia sacchari TaxID=1158459 RepID=UPI002ACE88FE|nr:hypothetical protein [Kosakonia sacchari]MDZ7322594.1 hypothetical protein [Kosakonia sacchari]
MHKLNYAVTFPHWQSPQLSLRCNLQWRSFAKVAVLFDMQEEALLGAQCEVLSLAGISAEQLWPVARASGGDSRLAELQTQCMVLSEAQRQGWRNVLLFDAGFQLTQDERVFTQANRIFTSLNRLDWHALLLGGHYQHFSPLLALPGIARVHHADRAAAYAVNASYYPVLLNAYHRAIEHAASLNEIWPLLMGKHCWLAVNPGLVSWRDNNLAPVPTCRPAGRERSFRFA